MYHYHILNTAFSQQDCVTHQFVGVPVTLGARFNIYLLQSKPHFSVLLNTMRLIIEQTCLGLHSLLLKELKYFIVIVYANINILAFLNSSAVLGLGSNVV